MRTLARYLQLLALTIWVGGLIFFAFVLAPTAFHILPSIHEAGLVVGACLKVFDFLALTAGLLFLIATFFLLRGARRPYRRRLELQLALAALMMIANGFLAGRIIPAMDADQAAAGGDIQALPSDASPRIDFERLHNQSERTAGLVLLLGLGLILVVAQEQPMTAPDRTSAVTRA